LADYKRISDLAEKIRTELPDSYRPAFFEMVVYPVIGAYQMNRKFLLAQLNKEKLEEKNYAVANWAAKQAQAAFDSINNLTEKYNMMLDGKWNGIMKLAPGWVAKYQDMPNVVYTKEAGIKPLDISPHKSRNQLKDCMVVDLEEFENKVSKEGHTLRVINGIGYDWNCVQLGEANEQTADPGNLNGSRFEYEFPKVNTDSVTVYIFSVPVFPIYNGRSTKYGISVDRQPVIIANNEPKEFSKQWKDQVLQNGVIATAKFGVQKNAEKHTLTLTCGDPGVIIQRIIIDWGGLKTSYVGPSVNLR
jgi:hypothetical protein